MQLDLVPFVLQKESKRKKRMNDERVDLIYSMWIILELNTVATEDLDKGMVVLENKHNKTTTKTKHLDSFSAMNRHVVITKTEICSQPIHYQGDLTESHTLPRTVIVSESRASSGLLLHVSTRIWSFYFCLPFNIYTVVKHFKKHDLYIWEINSA